MAAFSRREDHPAVRPRRIGVCGGWALPERAEFFCRTLGRVLAESNMPILVTGGCHYREGYQERLSADWYTVDGAVQVLKSVEQIHSRIETLLPETGQEIQDQELRIRKFQMGRVIRIPPAKPRVRSLHLVASVDVLAAIAGDKNTEQNLQSGFAQELPTLPVPCFGGKALEYGKRYARRICDWFGIDATLWKQWLDLKGEGAADAELERIATSVAELLIARLRVACFVSMPLGNKY